MKISKNGPELKVPDPKVPDFVLDIYYDLRERRLLPLVALLIVALVALPIILSRGSGSSSSEEETAFATPSSTAPTSTLVVAKAAPGLREYRHRLAGNPKNPFKQQYAEPEDNESGESSRSGGAESTVTVESSESSEAPAEPAAGTSPSEGGGSGEGNGEPPEGGQLKYYSFAIDVRVVPVSSKKNKPEAVVHHNLPPMSMLPSRSVPALTFVGVSNDEKNAIMLVSDKVTGLFGDGTCVEGSENCQLLALEPGIPETVVYGADSRTYRIELLKLRLLKTDKLNTAPLGGPKKSGGSNGSGE